MDTATTGKRHNNIICFFGRTLDLTIHYSLKMLILMIHAFAPAICVIIPRNHGRVETLPQLPHRVFAERHVFLDTAPVTPPGPRTKQLLIRKPFLVDIYLDNEEMEDGIQRLLLSTDTLLWKCENQNVCQTLLQQVL